MLKLTLYIFPLTLETPHGLTLTIPLSNIAPPSLAPRAPDTTSAYAHALSPRFPPLSLFPAIHILVPAAPSAAPLPSSPMLHSDVLLSMQCDILCHIHMASPCVLSHIITLSICCLFLSSHNIQNHIKHGEKPSQSAGGRTRRLLGKRRVEISGWVLSEILDMSISI
jgi:hypothetical protein